MSVTPVTGQHVSVADTNTFTYPSAPAQNDLMLDIVGHFQNGTACNANGWASIFDQNASQWDISAGYKYAGASESATQTPGSLGAGKTHNAVEITGVTGTIGTDIPTQHHGVDVAVTGSNPYSYSSTSFNTAANNTGIYGLVGAVTINNNTDTFSGATLSGGNSPTVLATFIHNGGANRSTIQVLFYDVFATSGTAVQYTLSSISGTFTIGGAPVGFYALLSIANFSLITNYNGAIAESGSAVDTVGAVFGASAAIAESASAVDTVGANGAFGAAIAEAGSAIDTVGASAAFTAAIAEVVSSTDFVATVKGLSAAIVEIARATDLYNFIAIYFPEFSLMRATAVAATGAMSAASVACQGAMPPVLPAFTLMRNTAVAARGILSAAPVTDEGPFV
jgi:hypothetical protein